MRAESHIYEDVIKIMYLSASWNKKYKITIIKIIF